MGYHQRYLKKNTSSVVLQFALLLKEYKANCIVYRYNGSLDNIEVSGGKQF